MDEQTLQWIVIILLCILVVFGAISLFRKPTITIRTIQEPQQNPEF